MRLGKRYLLVFVAIVVGALAASPASAAGGSTPQPVASGFDNPRGVAFYHGDLMVAEAGTGGKNCTTSPPPGTVGAYCFGRTGKISKVDLRTGMHAPFVDNLFSVAEWVGLPGPAVLGLSGLSSRGSKLMSIEGEYPQLFSNYACAPGDTECSADLAAARKEAGALLAVSHAGTFQVVANVGMYDYDKSVNYANQEHDSNPYGVLAAKDGSYVADAGTNTLDFVSNHGGITILYHFPNKYAGFPSDEVPTCVARAADTLWVATLSGNLFKVQGTSATQVPEADLKHVTACASDRENVYFVNMWTPNGPPSPHTGNIVKLNAEKGSSSVIASGLNFPNMDTIGPGGNLYFSADSVCAVHGASPPAPVCPPSGGSVWKLALSHEDDED